jgi:hypothetical protein
MYWISAGNSLPMVNVTGALKRACAIAKSEFIIV